MSERNGVLGILQREQRRDFETELDLEYLCTALRRLPNLGKVGMDGHYQ